MPGLVYKALADGSLIVPGGVAARLGPGSQGVVISYPVAGILDDGNDTPILFMDNGPHPLTPDGVGVNGVKDSGRPPAVKFPAGTFAAGQLVSWVCSRSEWEARFLVAGAAPVPTDSAGRMIALVGSPDGGATYKWLKVLADGTVAVVSGDPVKPTYECSFLVTGVNNPLFALQATSKRLRIRRLWLLWPGKQAAASRCTLDLGRGVFTSGAGAGAGFIHKHQSTDPAPTAVPWLPPVVMASQEFGVEVFSFICPAADGAWDAKNIGRDYDSPSGSMKPLICEAGETLVISQNFAPAPASYDNQQRIYIAWTEE